MKILVILPFSFYRSSGSPLNSFYRIKCILELGHTIDIAAYPHGKDIESEYLRIYRIPKKKLFKTIQPGELFKKFIYEICLFINFLNTHL